MQAEETNTKELTLSEKEMQKKKSKIPEKDAAGKTFSYEEALKSSIEYFKGDELAATVWINKYALKDSFGNLFEKTPDDMHRRLARELSRIEKNIIDVVIPAAGFYLTQKFIHLFLISSFEMPGLRDDSFIGFQISKTGISRKCEGNL